MASGRLASSQAGRPGSGGTRSSPIRWSRPPGREGRPARGRGRRCRRCTPRPAPWSSALRLAIRPAPLPDHRGRYPTRSTKRTVEGITAPPSSPPASRSGARRRRQLLGPPRRRLGRPARSPPDPARPTRTVAVRPSASKLDLGPSLLGQARWVEVQADGVDPPGRPVAQQARYPGLGSQGPDPIEYHYHRRRPLRAVMARRAASLEQTQELLDALISGGRVVADPHRRGSGQIAPGMRQPTDPVPVLAGRTDGQDVELQRLRCVPGRQLGHKPACDGAAPSRPRPLLPARLRTGGPP